MVSILEFDPFFCLVNTLRKNYEGLDNNNVTLREEPPHQFRRSSYVAKIQKVILKTAYFKNMIPEFREKMKDKLVKKGIMRSNTIFGSTLKDIVQVCHVVIRVTGATSFKEGYFLGAFYILPDTSFLLWT